MDYTYIIFGIPFAVFFFIGLAFLFKPSLLARFQRSQLDTYYGEKGRKAIIGKGNEIRGKTKLNVLGVEGKVEKPEDILKSKRVLASARLMGILIIVIDIVVAIIFFSGQL